MASGLNKLGGNLWNSHNEAAAAQIKARIPLFKVEDERSMMERLLPSTGIGSSTTSTTSTSLLALQLQQNLRAKSSIPPPTASSTTSTKHTTPTNNQNTNTTNTTTTTTVTTATNNNLLTSMTSRLTALEKSHRTLRTELVKKDREVLEWKRKYETIAEAAEDDGVAKAAEQMQEMQRANLHLRAQVHEMESFLQDYGLIWVGKNDTKDEPTLSENIGSRIDFSLLFRRFEELNHLAGEGKAQISKDGKKARFNFDPEKIPLAVYQDGLFIRRGPFRPFAEDTTQRFVSDVLDGYFPPEFKNDYPDGVIFEIKNCSKETYTNGNGNSDSNFQAFGGQGNAVGGQDNNTRNTKPMSREEFLNRLPEKMISKGRVVNIRDGIASKLEGVQEEQKNNGGEERGEEEEECTSPLRRSSSGGIKIAQTPALTMLKRSATLGELHADEEVTTLRIKVPNSRDSRDSRGGTTSLLLKMYFSDTIGALRAHVASNLPTLTDFDLRTSYPSKIFRDDSITLVEAGLTPNAALIVSVCGGSSGKGGKK